MIFEAAISAFGEATKQKLSNPAIKGAPEDQLRNPLEALLQALASLLRVKALAVVGETHLTTDKIRPDFSITIQELLVGYIELKAPGKGADPGKFKIEHDKKHPRR